MKDTQTANALGLQRYIPLAVWAVAISVLVLIPFRIISYGLVPPDDARRHVGKVFTEHSYREIIVMRDGYSLDHSPGWDRLLRGIHAATGWGADALISFSVVTLLLVVLLVPLLFLRRPEAWLAALLAELVALPEIMIHLSEGRPYLVTMAVLLGVLLVWSRVPAGRPWCRYMLTTLGIALSVWMHGAWYLWFLPVLAFALAQRWRCAFNLLLCWGSGSFVAALLTGHPVAFLGQAIFIARSVAREGVPSWLLVGEFQPSRGELATLAVMGLVYLWRGRPRLWSAEEPSAPVFWLIVLCWVSAFHVYRFWADWGMPAVLVWLALQFQEVFARWQIEAPRRVALALFAGVPLLLHATNDLDRRYSKTQGEQFLDAKDCRLAGWLPAPGGIFYSADMSFFYSTFYHNPDAPWRYILGMEPALMPEEDRQIFRRIQRLNYAFEAYEPWVAKMRPEDRLAITCPAQPAIPQLEWLRGEANLWIGRLPARR